MLKYWYFIIKILKDDLHLLAMVQNRSHRSVFILFNFFYIRYLCCYSFSTRVHTYLKVNPKMSTCILNQAQNCLKTRRTGQKFVWLLKNYVYCCLYRL